jgi:hypothetical protein
VRNKKYQYGSLKILGMALCTASVALLAACGGDGSTDLKSGGSANSADSGGSGGGDAQGGQPGVSGKVTYDYVPTALSVNADGTRSARLDYAKTERRPVRHATVEAVSEDGRSVLGTGVTDDTGAYSISLPANARVYMRVMSQVSEGPADGPDYSVRVRDNTELEFQKSPDSAPLYAMRGSVFVTKATGTRIDMNAGSGWTGSSYGARRTAAPFAILDQIVTAAQKLHRAAPDVKLPALNVFWSTRNRPTAGEAGNGMITTSHYNPAAALNGLYILGAQDVDTDEYDSSVMIHEFGHYVEDKVSRSDTIGGNHSFGDKLDMRTAFGEAWGNAFSSMTRDTPDYTDTMGPQQSQSGVIMNLSELSNGANEAWFDESALGRFLYSLYLSPDIGFDSIYRTMLDGQKQTPALTSVFSFATALRAGLGDAGKATLDQLLTQIKVQAGPELDAWGTRMRALDAANDNPAVFPIYVPLTLGVSARACSTTQFGAGNKLGNYSFLRVAVPSAGRYGIAVAPEGGVHPSSYAMNVYRFGKLLAEIPGTNDTNDYEFDAPGDYVIALAPIAATRAETEPVSAPQCAAVSVQALNQ